MPEPTDANINDCRYQSPPFWDRSVLFFANLKSLFLGNTEQTDELANLVGEIDSYGGRLASVLNLIYRGNDNVLFLERMPDEALLNYFADSLHLPPPRIEILSHQSYLSVPNSNNPIPGTNIPDVNWIDGYVTDEMLKVWAKATRTQPFSTAEGCRSGNNKTELYQHITSLGLPTPDTILAGSADEVNAALQSLRKKGYRNAVARAAIGASGIGMLKVDLKETTPTEIPLMFFHGGPCLVQGWLEPGIDEISNVSSPSVQIFVDEKTVHLFDITDQILSDSSVHEGNHSPPSSIEHSTQNELIRQAGVASAWLHSQGYRGTASVDFLVAEKSREIPTVYICEINARITGATYPSVVGRHLAPKSAWLMRNLRLENPIPGQELLVLIERSKHLFRAGDTKGIVPMNFNFDRAGLTRKGQFLCLAPSVRECSELLDSLVASLPFKTETERD